MASLITMPVPIALDQAHIFVAEDDPGIAALMQDLLQEEGYSIIVLQYANNAYEEIAQTLPDLVILDITLARQGDGWLILNKLRHNPKTAHVPVLICSGEIRGLRARQEERCAMGYILIQKPFDIDTLLTAVQEGLSGSLQVKNFKEAHKPLYQDIAVRDRGIEAWHQHTSNTTGD